MDHLLMIKQGEDKSLRVYVKRFNREVLEVDEVEDQVQLTTFKASLKFKDFVFVLAKSPSATRPLLLLNDQKYMNVEDALAAIRIEDTQKDKGNTKEDQKGRKRERKDYSSSYDSAKFKNDKPKKW